MAELSIPRLTAREIATGVVLDLPDTVEPLPAPLETDPLAALDQAVRPALLRPPCLVSFSGGLDSSLVLAIAVRVARAEGLPDPVPVTLRFPDAPGSDESAWQDAVIGALGVNATWQILTLTDELDIVGEVAQRALRRYGLLHPTNAHGNLPILELGMGGSLLTGYGGDQMLSGLRSPAPRRRRSRTQRALNRLRRLPTALYRRLTHTGAPARSAFTFEWLQPTLADEARAAWQTTLRSEPERLDQRIGWHLHHRDLVLTQASLAAVGADHNVVVRHPLLDPGFLAALSARHGHRRHARRDDLLAHITGDALPAVVTAPRRKATFADAYRRRPTRDFVQSWDGTGIDNEFVDTEALRRVWSRWPIPAITSTLVQQVWLATRPDSPGDRRASTTAPRPAPPTGLEAAR